MLAEKHDMPFLGRLDPEIPEHRKYFIDREKEKDDILSRIKFHEETGQFYLGILCGSPGCGKTTFSKYVAHEKKAESVYIDLNKHVMLQTPHSYGDIRISPNAIISFFCDLEIAIIERIKLMTNNKDGGIINIDHKNRRKKYDQILKGIEIPELDRDEFNLLLNNKKNDKVGKVRINFLDVLMNPIIKNFLKLTSYLSGDQRILIFADNLDYLHTEDMCLLLMIFYKLALISYKGKFLFSVICSGRPVNSGVMRGSFRCLYRGEMNVSELTLKDVDLLKVIDARINQSKYADKIILEKDLKDFIVKFCCGNIQKGIDIYSAFILDYECRIKPKRPYNLQHACSMQYAFSLPYFKENVPDIFDNKSLPGAIKNNAPILFAILLSLPERAKIDKSYFDSFRVRAREIVISHSADQRRAVKNITNKEIQECLYVAIKMYLIRRLDTDSIVVSDMVKDSSRVEGWYCSLTQRGLLMLKMIKNQHYLNSTRYDSLPKGVQTYISQVNVSSYDYESENTSISVKC